MTTELIYDWNKLGMDELFQAGRSAVSFNDETLRDGLQNPSVRHPSIEEKLEILHLMEDIGIEMVNIGLPGAGPHVVKDVTRLAQEISSCKMKIRPNCAARTLKTDIQHIVEISQKVGITIEACTFIGSSFIRQFTEDWTLDMMLRATEEGVSYTVKNGLPNMYVTEDTTRAHPDTLKKLYGCALDCGATALTICDTVGHATPNGTRQLVTFVRNEIVAPRNVQVRIDWHGHMDRGLGLMNSITAVEVGVNQVHGCALGIGERVGNTPLDLLLVNMQLLGLTNKNLIKLKDYCQVVSRAFQIPVPSNYPVFGVDAFRTGTGVHAAAVIKALGKDDLELANLVYSGVPCHWFGMRQLIEVGPMSGKSNVIYWLGSRGIEAEEDVVQKILDAAKASNRVLGDEEIRSLVGTSPS